jgi:hypothetical protein
MPPVVVRSVRRRRRSRLAGLFLVALVLVIAAVTYEEQDSRTSNSGYLLAQQPDPYDQEVNESAASVLSTFDEPLNTGGIDRSVAAAVRFHAVGDLKASAEYSRICQNQLRNRPNLARFDSCAAFDEAAAALIDGTPGADSGPFNESEIIARQISSAQMISDDLVGADSRLHQIRTRVQLELVPLLDKAAQQNL